MTQISDAKAANLKKYAEIAERCGQTVDCQPDTVLSLLAARDALAKLVRRCRESPQLEPLLHDRVSDSLCHASCPLCSAIQVLGGKPSG